jgi:hypothetical protein
MDHIKGIIAQRTKQNFSVEKENLDQFNGKPKEIVL